MNDTELQDLRRDFSRQTLSRKGVHQNPHEQFSRWMAEALASHIIDANAMTLATVDAECRPSSRVVLLKKFDRAGFSFFTNYESRKGRDLAGNPHAALNFFWPELERQVNISGKVEKILPEESEAYFRSRPLESRIAAWASSQSSVIESRGELERAVDELRARFPDEDVPLPPFWGGFRLIAERFEFWQGRPSRLHDRIMYERNGDRWSIARLSP